MLPAVDDNKSISHLLVNSTPSQPGAYNMALDQALFESTYITRGPVWRLYVWDPPAVSIGRNQKVREAVNAEIVLERQIPMVRRPTGGRAIWHSGDICFTFTGVTAGDVEPASASRHDYLVAAEVIVRFLNTLGIAGEISNGVVRDRRFRGSIKAPCFQSPGRFEIMVGSKKIAGIAQYRSGARFLIQGSIRVSEIDSSSRDLFFEQGDPGAEAFAGLRDSVTSIKEQLHQGISWNRMLRSFSEAIGRNRKITVDFDVPDIGITSDELRSLQDKRYENPRWNERF